MGLRTGGLCVRARRDHDRARHEHEAVARARCTERRPPKGRQLCVPEPASGDAEGAAKPLNKYLGPEASSRIAAVAEKTDLKAPRRHQTAFIGVYGHQVRALLDTVAIPNVMSESLAKALGLFIRPLNGDLRVANGALVRGFGSVENVPVMFDTLVVPRDFAVLPKTLYDVLLGAPTLTTALQAHMDLAGQMVSLDYNGEHVTIPTEY